MFLFRISLREKEGEGEGGGGRERECIYICAITSIWEKSVTFSIGACAQHIQYPVVEKEIYMYGLKQWFYIQIPTTYDLVVLDFKLLVVSFYMFFKEVFYDKHA